MSARRGGTSRKKLSSAVLGHLGDGGPPWFALIRVVTQAPGRAAWKVLESSLCDAVDSQVWDRPDEHDALTQHLRRATNHCLEMGTDRTRCLGNAVRGIVQLNYSSPAAVKCAQRVEAVYS
jgi:hypothetical protein